MLCFTVRSFTSSAWLWLLYPASSYAAYLKGHDNTTSADLRAIFSGHNVHWSAGTVVAFPNSTEFTNATERRVAWEAPSYTAAISPDNEEDVATAVKLAVRHKIPFLATGGRHGSGTGYGELQGGLAIDLSQFKSFEVNVDASTVTIGGGASFGDFYDELYATGLMLPSGSCSCPGYAGLAVGGGVGRYMGTLGLVADRMVSARVVTAAGEVITVSKKEHAELFWGMRGAGANLGIITSATYQAAKAADHANGYALTIDMYFAANRTAAYFEHLERIADQLPANVAGLHLTSYNATTDQAELFVNWVWFGAEAGGRAFVSQFIAFGPYVVENYVYIPWSQIIAVAGNGIGQNGLCVKGVYANTYASNLKTLSASTYQATFDKMQQFYVKYPEGRGTASNLEIFSNQAVAALDEDFDAYPWRDARAFFTVSVYFGDASLSNQSLLDAGDSFGRELRDSWSKTGGYAKEGGTVYVNYARGDEPLESVYGVHKLPRLAALKKKWDPNRVFAYNNVLPTIYP